jgi:hypothetical protein
MNDELERLWNEAIVVYLKMLSPYLHFDENSSLPFPNTRVYCFHQAHCTCQQGAWESTEDRSILRFIPGFTLPEHKPEFKDTL